MGKAARAKAGARATTARRPARRVSPPRKWWGWVAVLAVIAVVAAVVLWQAGRSGDNAHPVALTHVHGLGINPADGTLHVATHDGLYQLPAQGGTPRLVGDGRQDTMGFTVAGPNQFLASGHPAPGQGGPDHLGLIESSDAGVTWKTLSLAGEADFHALRYRHNTVYGYNSVTGQLLTSADRTTWQTRSAVALRDFDVSPADPNILLATAQTGLQRSTDGGATWAQADGPPLLLLAWETTDRLWGITTSGGVQRSTDGGSSWKASGRLAGQATALAAHDNTLYAAVHERGILRSTDGGSTWTTLYD